MSAARPGVAVSLRPPFYGHRTGRAKTGMNDSTQAGVLRAATGRPVTDALRRPAVCASGSGHPCLMMPSVWLDDFSGLVEGSSADQRRSRSSSAFAL
jgi:hypothetical protein